MTQPEFVSLCAWAAALTWALIFPVIGIPLLLATRRAVGPGRAILTSLSLTGFMSAAEAFALWWLVEHPPATRDLRMYVLDAIFLLIVARGIAFGVTGLRAIGLHSLMWWDD